jgi:hypothetical protein
MFRPVIQPSSGSYCGAILTHLTTIVFMYQRLHTEDGRTTGRNMMVKILKTNKDTTQN